MSHTPGPWKIEGHEVFGAEGQEFVLIFDPKTETGRSNARLIAAAPDLLEALEGLLPLCESLAGQAHPKEQRDDCRACRARAAIAKARGES